MAFPEDWADVLDERNELLVKIGEFLYEGDFNEMKKDLYSRLRRKPMYPQLYERITEEIERVEEISFYHEVDRFIRERIIREESGKSQ